MKTHQGIYRIEEKAGVQGRSICNFLQQEGNKGGHTVFLLFSYAQEEIQGENFFYSFQHSPNRVRLKEVRNR